jgi:hypothetical protein
LGFLEVIKLISKYKFYAYGLSITLLLLFTPAFYLFNSVVSAATNPVQFSLWFATMNTSRDWVSNGTLVPSTPTGSWSSPKCTVMVMDPNYNYGSTAGPLAVFCPFIIKNEGTHPINITLSTTQQNIAYTQLTIHPLPAGAMNAPNFNNQSAVRNSSLIQPDQTALLFFAVILTSLNSYGTPNPYRGQTFNYSFTLVATAASPNSPATYAQNIYISGTGRYVGPAPTPTENPTANPTPSPSPTSSPDPTQEAPTVNPTAEPTSAPTVEPYQDSTADPPASVTPTPTVPESSTILLLAILSLILFGAIATRMKKDSPARSGCICVGNRPFFLKHRIRYAYSLK